MACLSRDKVLPTNEVTGSPPQGGFFVRVRCAVPTRYLPIRYGVIVALSVGEVGFC